MRSKVPHQIVIDTNVFIASLRSKYGASYKLLMLLESGKYECNFSVPLILEYEDVAKRLINEIPLTATDIDNIIDYLCSVGNYRKIFYLWRPFLNDPKDDMILELAVSARCNIIVTYNKKDFNGAEKFGIRILTAKEFLQEIGEIP
ncbi:MAG: putative toxin-antitoxin system toxin component, PIN family [Desulfobacterales bacterium]|nr:putative toxin-antitoxin system toxin component, PIN family [Desulfobacterales bacterium]